MFELETETLQKIIKDNTIGNAQSISLKSILESNIPANVKCFFKAEVEWLLSLERKTETNQGGFDYSQEDVRLLQEQTDLLLIYHFNFSQKEFDATNDRCSHFLFNFLCRPVWTLENFLFDEKSTLSTRELSLKFRFCNDYSYYWTILEKYLVTKNKNDLSKEETITILQKIDREIIRDNSAEELARMTEPFFNFVSYIQHNADRVTENGIPTKALTYFFDDKGLKSVSEHLLRLREQGKNVLQHDDLVSILKNTFVKKGSYVERESLQIPRPEPAISPSDLLIPERDRLNIIDSIFKKEESHYQDTVQKILSQPSWDDAALALDHFFTMNDIEPYSREAIVFTNALQSFFSNRTNS
ncbi:MAG: hypothetical protein HYV29_08695 [Ignavibacteriales bacterium]|nr:hypothetical protein [Ignavibacteriales bacterium]